jgi:hypothetical protein
LSAENHCLSTIFLTIEKTEGESTVSFEKSNPNHP